MLQKQVKNHNVILMADLGDLREGFFELEELVDVAKYVEKDSIHRAPRRHRNQPRMLRLRNAYQRKDGAAGSLCRGRGRCHWQKAGDNIRRCYIQPDAGVR